MSVDPRISLEIVRKELIDCQQDIKRYKWEISEIDEQSQTFIVKMKSPIDNQQYIIEIKFDNYKEWPLYIEFIDPVTNTRGTKNAYPVSDGSYGNLFHSTPCICNPCSRKAYSEHRGPHADWNIIGWQQNPKTSSLTNIRAILRAIYYRISNPDIYRGRMNG